MPPASGGSNDRRQCLERRRHAIELATAVVRDDDAGGAVLGREHRIPGFEDSLDDDRNRHR